MTTYSDQQFLSWYDAYSRDIYRFVASRVSTKEGAEDIVSDVFLSAWQHRLSYDETKASPRTWLYTIAKRKIIDSYRRAKPQSEISEDIASQLDLMETVHWRLLSEDLQQHLATLSSEQREILELRLWYGYSHAEIAQIMHKDERAVRVMFHRALEKIKKQVTHQSFISFLILPLFLS